MVLTIDRGSIRTIASRADVVGEFPFLADYARRPAPGCCASTGVRIDGNIAVRQIAGLPPDRRNQLKRILGADTIRLRIVQAGRLKTVEI